MHFSRHVIEAVPTIFTLSAGFVGSSRIITELKGILRIF